jgi:hypothetical protein
MPGEGWERVGRPRRHRPGAQTISLRSTDWRGERVARMFVAEAFGPEVCDLCDCPVERVEDAETRWRFAHRACTQRAVELIMERRPAIPGSKGHWGLIDLRVAEPGSAEAADIEARRARVKPELTAAQREEAAFLRAMAGSGE